MFGGPANTTYGENTGVLELSKVYDPKVVRLAAFYAIILSFIPKISQVIGTMPAAIIGGISNSRNLIIAASILVCGLGLGGGITFTVGSTTITLTALAIASIVGVVLNAILPGKDYEFGINEEGDKNRGVHM